MGCERPEMEPVAPFQRTTGWKALGGFHRREGRQALEEEGPENGLSVLELVSAGSEWLSASDMPLNDNKSKRRKTR